MIYSAIMSYCGLSGASWSESGANIQGSTASAMFDQQTSKRVSPWYFRRFIVDV